MVTGNGMQVPFQCKRKPNLGSVQVGLENGVNLLGPNYLYTPVRIPMSSFPMLAPGKTTLTMRKLQTEPFDLAPLPAQSVQGCQSCELPKIPYREVLDFQSSGGHKSITRIGIGFIFGNLSRDRPDLGDPKDQGSSSTFSSDSSTSGSKRVRFFEEASHHRFS